MAGEAGDSAALPEVEGLADAKQPMFRGVTALALDAKGRLAIPAKHRDALAPQETGASC